jgi:hypothetical protein
MTTYQIEIACDSIEAEEFVAWLNKKGHDAEVGNSTENYIDCICTHHDLEMNEIMNALWDEYCNE